LLASALLGYYARAAIEEFCDWNGIEVVGGPFDPEVTKATMASLPVVEYTPDSQASEAMKSIWERLTSILG
jgi:MinD superfamily P-loop ATPase